MERIKLYIKLFLVLVVFPIALGGCASGALPTDYRNEPFRAQITWQTDSVRLSTSVRWESSGRREMEILEPKEWMGLVLMEEGNKRMVRYGDVTMDGAGMEALFERMELLLPTGERRGVCKTEWKGETVMYVEIEGETVVELYLEPESGIPRAIRRGDVTLEIQSFERISQESVQS